MNLLVAEDDYCVQKIVLVASLAGLELTVKKGVTAKTITDLDGKAKSVVLTTPAGNLGQHTAILKYLGEVSPVFPLNGVSEIERAQVNQWVGFSWSELGELNFFFIIVLNIYIIN